MQQNGTSPYMNVIHPRRPCFSPSVELDVSTKGFHFSSDSYVLCLRTVSVQQKAAGMRDENKNGSGMWDDGDFQ